MVWLDFGQSQINQSRSMMNVKKNTDAYKY